jgi:hypothetical protein
LPLEHQVQIGSTELDVQPEEDTGQAKDDGRQKTRIGRDAERRGRLPDIWYSMINGETCIRTLILDYFSEPMKYRDEIRSTRCCSRCNKSYDLGKLDRAEHYLYSEKGNQYGKMQKAISQDLEAWTSKQLDKVFPYTLFTPTADCFLSESERTRLAKDAHTIFNLAGLEKALNGWPHLPEFGQELLHVLRETWANIAKVGVIIPVVINN